MLKFRKYFKKTFLYISCSLVLLLNQNCGGDGFSSSDLLSIDHGPSDLNGSNNANYATRMGDRVFVSSVLASVFFPEGETDLANAEIDNVHKDLQEYVSASFTSEDISIHNIIRENILRKYEEFKGPCSIYEKDSLCNGLSTAQVEIDVVGVGSVSKEGMRVSACYQILDRDRAVNNVIDKVSVSQNIELITENEIDGVFNLFYPGLELEQSSKSSLVSLANATLASTNESIETWRMVLLAVCQTGAWQIP